MKFRFLFALGDVSLLRLEFEPGELFNIILDLKRTSSLGIISLFSDFDEEFKDRLEMLKDSGIPVFFSKDKNKALVKIGIEDFGTLITK